MLSPPHSAGPVPQILPPGPSAPTASSSSVVHRWWGSHQHHSQVPQHWLLPTLPGQPALSPPHPPPTSNPSLSAGGLMAEFTSKREAIRWAGTPGLAPRPMAPSSLPLRGWKGSPSLQPRLSSRTPHPPPHLHQRVPQITQTQPGQTGTHFHSLHKQLLLLDAPTGRRALPYSFMLWRTFWNLLSPRTPLPATSKSCPSVCHTSQGAICPPPTLPLTCQGHRHRLPPGPPQPLPPCPVPREAVPPSNPF